MTSELSDYKVEAIENIQLPLVNRFYKDCRYSAKAGRGEFVYVVRERGVIVAAVRLQSKPDWLFLRSMCVAPEFRGQGIGSLLLDGLGALLSQHHCFCYPFEHLHDFYAEGGFSLVSECQGAEQEIPQFMTEPLERYRKQGRKLILMRRLSSHQ